MQAMAKTNSYPVNGEQEDDRLQWDLGAWFPDRKVECFIRADLF